MRSFTAPTILYVRRLQTDILMLVDNNGRIGVQPRKDPPPAVGAESARFKGTILSGTLNAPRHAFQFLLRSKDGAGAPFRTETPQSS
ncbi:MAG: hypothetical protein CL478_04570 [Acidobacteria bacterium]|nr:hypothetical protein [Acidobacteriota bacterium]